MSSDYVLTVRNANRVRVGEIDDFRRFEALVRFCKMGHWLLEVPADSDAADLLTWTSGIILLRGTEVVMSGEILLRRYIWNKDEFVLIVAGADDLVWIEDRLALPVPSGPPYDAAAYDVRTGPAETVMRAYVNVNAGPGSTAARQVAGLTLAPDQARGATVTGRARFSPLGDLLRGLAIGGGDLGWRVVQSGANLEFQVYQPTDKRALVKFSPELGNLASYDYTEEASKANYVYCGGSGEGTARVIREGSDAAAIARYGRRIEMFRDRRDTSDAAELDQTIAEELTENAARTELSIEPVDTEAVSFWTDYYLGDEVTLVTHGGVIEEKIREVRFRMDGQEGVNVTPSVLSPNNESRDLYAGLFDQVRRLSARIGQLERR